MHDTEKYFIPREFLKIRIPSHGPAPQEVGEHIRTWCSAQGFINPLQCFPGSILLTCLSPCQKTGISVFLQSKHLLFYFDFFSEERGSCQCSLCLQQNPRLDIFALHELAVTFVSQPSCLGVAVQEFS